MNMPSPMNENSYKDSVDAVRKAAQTVCLQSMRSAVENVKNVYERDEDGVFDMGISGDGTWKWIGYSFIFEIAMSTVTCKAIDTEVMSKECGECIVWRNKEGTQLFEDWWDSHQHFCQANHAGPSGSMDVSRQINSTCYLTLIS